MFQTEFTKLNSQNNLNINKPIINNLGVPLTDVLILHSLKQKKNTEDNLLRKDKPVTKEKIFANLVSTEKVKISLSFSRKILRFAVSSFRFVATTGILFIVLFVLFNFSAYQDKFWYWYKRNVALVEADPAQETSQNILENLLETEKEKPVSQEKRIIVKEEIKDVQTAFDLGTEVIDFSSFSVNPSDFRILIPKIEKNIPVIPTNPEYLIQQDWAGLEEQIQKDLRGGVIHYPGTAYPGQIGNVFITGHSSYYFWDPGRYKNVFALLDRLVAGDKVIVYFDSKKYIYEVYDIKVVEPDETSVLSQPMNRSILTLMTCTPTGTVSKRLIVNLQQIFPDPAQNTIPEWNDGNVIIRSEVDML